MRGSQLTRLPAMGVLVLGLAMLAICADRRRLVRPGQTFRELERVTVRGWNADLMEPFLTRDGYLLFNDSNAPGHDTNLHFAERVDDLTFDYRGEIQGVNTTALDAVATMDAHGTLYFVSTRSYPQTLSTLYRGNFSAGMVVDIQLVPGVSRLQAGIVQFDVGVSADGSTLYVSEGLFRTGPVPKAADLLVARRKENEFVRSPENDSVLANVNTAALEYAASVSADGLELFFTRLELGESIATPSIWRARRSTPESAFGIASRLEGASGFVEAPSLSPDEQSLYFHRKEGDRFVLYLLKR